MTERERDKMVDACKGMTKAEATHFVARVFHDCDIDPEAVAKVYSSMVGNDVRQELSSEHGSEEAR